MTNLLRSPIAWWIMLEHWLRLPLPLLFQYRQQMNSIRCLRNLWKNWILQLQTKQPCSASLMRRNGKSTAAEKWTKQTDQQRMPLTIQNNILNNFAISNLVL
uniref:ATP synthase F0 subunit 8 n=1 Tax=Cacopsylla melanoneura TaxID=428564 RepID=A0A8D8YN59_9HEMI